jgi:putative peptidoglycan lipid II flippase
MNKASRIFRISLLLAVFFGLDKGLGIIRQLLIAREFGLSQELDVFNAANNLPDLLFALISGGALTIALIPVLSEVLSKKGKPAAWRLFSNIANLAFVLTGVISILVAILAEPLVSGQLGIAPGFTPEQQSLTVSLMRLNLIATLIFSISGLVMAGLQANQHFLLPALAPIFYDLGQIFGAVILAPARGYHIGGLQLPAFGMGVRGLVFGVIIGASLHLLIQIPGLIKYHFKWHPEINIKDAEVKKVLSLMGPRLLSVLAFQLIFLAQDNLASRLQIGSVTALTYGWLIMQVPETLIGTAIATALLPTLSEFAVKEQWDAFKSSISNAFRVLMGLTLPITAILAMGLLPLIQTAFDYNLDEARIVLWVTQAFLLGLTGHSLVELGVRSFYARQNARIPMFGSLLSLLLFIGLAVILMRLWGATGIATANSLAYTAQALFLLWNLRTFIIDKSENVKTLGKSLLASIIAGGLVWSIINLFKLPFSSFVVAVLAMGAGILLAAFILRKELRQVLRL